VIITHQVVFHFYIRDLNRLVDPLCSCPELHHEHNPYNIICIVLLFISSVIIIIISISISISIIISISISIMHEIILRLLLVIINFIIIIFNLN
jgi:hypothetical protein